jgi:cytochrome c oxidase subunit IV
VAYLFGDFRIWTLLRWSFFRFLLIAAGGIVPFLSFFTERHYTKVAQQQLTASEVRD